MKTMDGVNITVGMRLFWRTMNPESSTTGFVVSSLDDEGRPLFVAGDEEVYVPVEMGLYSTRDAGKVARWAKPVTGMSSDDETLDALLRDIGRAAVARCRLFHDRTDNGRAAYIDAEKRLYRLYHRLPREQIDACVGRVKKDATK